MKNKQLIQVIYILLSVILFSPKISYSLDNRYSKFDAHGTELPSDAPEWSIIFDSSTRLYWEVKTDVADIHSKDDTFSYSKAKKNLIAVLNKNKFGGFSDWRLPTINELSALIEKKDEAPYINTEAFPNTSPSDYISWELCGNGEISPKKVPFGKQKAKKRNRFVRAVRGNSPDGFDRY